MANIYSLPDEILVRVAKAVRYKNASTQHEMADLLALAQVSRRFAKIARDVLYQSPKIHIGAVGRQSPLLAFLQNFLRDPSLISKTKSLDVCVGVNSLKRYPPSHRLAARSSQLDQETLTRLSEVQLENGAPWWLYSILTSFGEDTTWLGLILAFQPPLKTLTLRISSDRMCATQDIYDQYLDNLFLDLFYKPPAPQGKITWRSKRPGCLEETQTVIIAGEDICAAGARDDDEYQPNWNAALQQQMPHHPQLNRVTVWEVDMEKKTLLSYSRTSGDFFSQQKFLSRTLNLAVQNGQSFYGRNGKKQNRKTCRSFQHLVSKIPTGWYRVLIIRVDPKENGDELPVWLPKIERARTIGQFSQLKVLVVPQDFLFKRYPKPGVLKFRPIHRFLWPGRILKLTITYATENIAIWLDALANTLEGKEFQLKEISLWVDGEVRDSFPLGWVSGIAIWSRLNILGIQVSFRNLRGLSDYDFKADARRLVPSFD
ncbi:hypothetical protein DM02DRAFT_654437 [Periconia macrospinosa]|uniref:F-box domain-containing protein n=1 Tax=Periconia macrospinosa TaxID=97972 RepID=A0A2V1DTD3_9PLEO|nr:hypothetical protein DM02DRAFT_654437 [Periconia macrospinosa]